MASVLEALMKEIGQIQQKDLPSGSPVGPYIHGPGGLFGVEGLEKPVISTRVRGMGLAGRLPARGSVTTNPLFPYITGFLAASGTNADTVCDDPRTAGPIKNCFQTADFGRYSFQSREVELNRIGQRVNRGEFFDLELVNPLLQPQGGILNPESAGGTDILANEMRTRMIEIGVQFENQLARQIYVGNPANNSAGGGYQEFPGLDILIGTNKVDAKTGTPCPSLHSDIKGFNYSNVTTSGGGTIVNVLTYMMRMLRRNSDTMGMSETTWAIVMRPSLWWELTAVWPCAYATYRCLAQDNTQTQLVIDANDQIAMRDEMRNGNYLMIDGIKYPVILDTGIVEENRADNAAIPITGFASDIYVVPLTVRNGSMAVTYWEYFDYSAENAAMAAARVGGWDSFFWTDSGRYLWHRKPPLNWCVQMLAKIEPRIILQTPHLAGRVTDVVYVPLQHERDFVIGDDYFIDGGVQNRAPGLLYSDWHVTDPA